VLAYLARQVEKLQCLFKRDGRYALVLVQAGKPRLLLVGSLPYLHRRARFCLTLPRICLDREEPALRHLAEAGLKKGCDALSVQNLGQLALAERLGVPARGDFGLNVFNSRSLQELSRWGLESAALSFELRWEQIRDLRKPLPCEAVVYGRLPLMLTENCLTANALGGCGARNLAGPCRRDHALTDRRGEEFPVLPAFGCRSEVENSKVLYLAGKPELRRCGLTWIRLRFTTETGPVCGRVLDQYLRGEDSPPEHFTRGLFYRGVE
jgi:putative protease